MTDSRLTSEHTSKFFTVLELAEFLRISRVSVYRIIERRDIPFYRTAKRILFRVSDVEAYLERCRVATFDESVPRRKPNPVQ